MWQRPALLPIKERPIMKWKLVPVEPTNGMRDAGHRAAWRRIPSLFDEGDAANVYRAMLAAAPAAPEQDGVARDAERYRWLKCERFDKPYAVTNENMTAVYEGDELDSAIDAAIAAEKGGA